MENLFDLKDLKKTSLDYKSDEFHKEYVDAFYIYEYIIKYVLPELIRNKYFAEYYGKKKNIILDLANYTDYNNKGEFPFVLVDKWKEDTLAIITIYNGAEKDKDVNNTTFRLFYEMLVNFINFYHLGYAPNKSDYNFIKRLEIDTSVYQLVDAFYSEWQRIDYETKEIIDDYQDEYGIDRKVLLPGESNINLLKRKKEINKGE